MSDGNCQEGTWSERDFEFIIVTASVGNKKYQNHLIDNTRSVPSFISNVFITYLYKSLEVVWDATEKELVEA